jgi:hypothetical protein
MHLNSLTAHHTKDMSQRSRPAFAETAHPLTSTVRRPSTSRPDWSAHEAPFPGPRRPLAVSAAAKTSNVKYETSLFSQRKDAATATPAAPRTKHNLSLQCSIENRASRAIPLFVQDKLTGRVTPLARERPPPLGAGVNASALPSASAVPLKKKTGTSVRTATRPSTAGTAAVDDDAEPPMPDDLVLNHFELFYVRSDLPLRINHNRSATARELEWAHADEDKINLEKWIPVFFQGLVYTTEPLEFIANEGIKKLLPIAGGARIAAMLPEILTPLMIALASDDQRAVAAAMRSVQLLTQLDATVAQQLIHQYSRLVPYFNKHRIQPSSSGSGDAIDYGQNDKTKINLADLGQQTLKIMEETGGAYAQQRIKFCMPTYESQV